MRANLVPQAEQWRWSSLSCRLHGNSAQQSMLSDWPLPMPRTWKAIVNKAQAEAEVEAIRRSVTRGQPYGSEAWVQATARDLGLSSTLRRRGRPKQAR